MTVTSTESGSMVGTFLLLRKAIGWIGTLLPIVVIVGEAAFSSGPLPNSLSDYYYTPMRNILVGALCVLGVFLLLYDVSVRVDRWLTNAAGIGVLGVAFLPGSPPVPHLTTSAGGHRQPARVLRVDRVPRARRHDVALRLRRQRRPGRPAAVAPRLRLLQGQRLRHARLRASCSGVAILLPLSIQNSTLAIYDTEALAIFTFGVSWLVKGRALQPLASAPADRADPGPADQDAGRAASV